MTEGQLRGMAEAFAEFIREEMAEARAEQEAELAKLRQDIDALTALLAEKETNQ